MRCNCKMNNAKQTKWRGKKHTAKKKYVMVNEKLQFSQLRAQHYLYALTDEKKNSIAFLTISVYVYLLSIYLTIFGHTLVSDTLMSNG